MFLYCPVRGLGPYQSARYYLAQEKGNEIKELGKEERKIRLNNNKNLFFFQGEDN